MCRLSFQAPAPVPVSAEWDEAKWCKRLGGSKKERAHALSRLASTDCPDRAMGESILLRLMENGQKESFELACKHAGRAWCLTSLKFNRPVLLKVFQGETDWLKVILEEGLTQSEYFKGHSYRPSNVLWLNALVDEAPHVENGWRYLELAMDAVPSLLGGAFGAELTFNRAHPSSMPESVAKRLRTVEVKEVRRRAWNKHELITAPESEWDWKRSENPLSIRLRQTYIEMEVSSPSLAIASLRILDQEVDALLALGADPSALHNGEPMLCLVGALEREALSYQHEKQAYIEITRHVDSIFKKLVANMRVDMMVSGEDEKSGDTLAMLFAEQGALSCARACISLGCKELAQDDNGYTWKMRALASSGLDIEPLSPQDVLTRSHHGENILHLLTKFSTSWVEDDKPQIVRLMTSCVELGLSFDEQDGEGCTAQEYAKRDSSGLVAECVSEVQAKILLHQTPRPLRSSLAARRI